VRTEQAAVTPERVLQEMLDCQPARAMKMELITIQGANPWLSQIVATRH